MILILIVFTSSSVSRAEAPSIYPDLTLQACKAESAQLNLSDEIALLKFQSKLGDVRGNLDALFGAFIKSIDPVFMDDWRAAMSKNDTQKIKELELRIPELALKFQQKIDTNQQNEWMRIGIVSEARRLADVLRSDAEMGSITPDTIEKYRQISKEVKGLPKQYSESEVFLFDQDIENLQKRAATQKGKGLNAPESCTPVDLHQSPALGPIRDQGDTGWCYAFTLSDLISQKLQSRVHPVALALHYNLDKYDEDVRQSASRGEFILPSTYQHKSALEKQGGTFKLAFESAVSRWFCVDDGTPFFLDNPREHRLLCDFWMLSRSKLHYDELVKGRKQGEAHEFACKTYQYMHQALFRNLLAEDFLSALNRATVDEFTDQLTSDVCKKKITPKKDNGVPSLAIQYFEKDSQHSSRELLNMLDVQLGKKNISAIGVNPKIFYDATATSGTSEDNLHGVSVVGRKFDPETKECFYLIRNSWGLDWKPEHQGPASLGLEAGHAWVSARDLARNVVDIAYLE